MSLYTEYISNTRFGQHIVTFKLIRHTQTNIFITKSWVYVEFLAYEHKLFIYVCKRRCIFSLIFVQKSHIFIKIKPFHDLKVKNLIELPQWSYKMLCKRLLGQKCKTINAILVITLVLKYGSIFWGNDLIKMVIFFCSNVLVL